MGQVIAETFKSLAGMEMNFVPYQGGVQATISVVGGHAPVLVAPLSDAGPHILSGKLRGLGVTSLERSEALREVPTVAESGYPGFEWLTWIGAAVPARTPKAVIEQLSAAMLRAVRTPETKAGFSRLSISAAPMDAAEFDAFMRAQMRSYETTVRQANIRVD
jgi:tripartite-type tricarboxylate transporter receptor subunit TctC